MNQIRGHLRQIRVAALASGAGLIITACAFSSGQDESPVVRTEEPIIAGVPANGAKLNAIGSIGYVYVDPYSQVSYYQPYCSGSLIGKQTVLTAKHCLQFFASDYGFGAKTVFAIGPDAAAPIKLVEVVDVQGAPVDAGGFVGFGHDVGVMYLGEKVSELTPLKLGTLKASDLGKKFIEIGYGVRDNTQAYGTRRTGNATLKATNGKVFEIIFGSFARFESWFQTGSPGTEALFPTGPVAPAAFLPTKGWARVRPTPERAARRANRPALAAAPAKRVRAQLRQAERTAAAATIRTPTFATSTTTRCSSTATKRCSVAPKATRRPATATPVRRSSAPTRTVPWLPTVSSRAALARAS